MKRPEETLRQLIREEVLAEAPSIDSYRKGPGIVVSRLGGWSHVPQEQGTAPTRSGLWAFIFPHFEPFLVGSTDHAGITSGTKRPSRYELMKSNKRADPSLALKHARYVGSLYTRLARVPGAEEDPENPGWALVDADSLRKYVNGRYANDLFASATTPTMRKNFWGDKQTPKAIDLKAINFSKDEYEVFIPRGEGRFI
jgi:hypothetical protein